MTDYICQIETETAAVTTRASFRLDVHTEDLKDKWVRFEQKKLSLYGYTFTPTADGFIAVKGKETVKVKVVSK